MSLLKLLFCVCLTALAASSQESWEPKLSMEHAEHHFEIFILEHGKQYNDEEEKQYRFEIFKKNLEKAIALNEEHIHTGFGITQFMDLTEEEFADLYLSSFTVPKGDVSSYGCTALSDNDIPDSNPPQSLDWRESGIVTPVPNQGQCGSCYSFSASGHIESLYARKYNQQVIMSKQQSVDCDANSSGCRGGLMSSAFYSMIQLGGIEAEQSYPYTARQQRCMFVASKAVARVTNCYTYSLSSQEKLKHLLNHVGPISVAVNANNFNYYNGGIMTDQACGYGQVNHAVLLVGYGTENGVPYWLIKNSWGTSFGLQGYIKIQRGESASSCGLMNSMMASAVIA